MMRPRGIRPAIKDWRQGRRDGFPLCCIAHFCWDALVGWPSSVVRWQQIYTDPSDRACFVVCGIVHSGGSPYGLFNRLRRILDFQWHYLQPTSAGRRRRQLAVRGSQRWRRATAAEKVAWSRAEVLARHYWDDGGLDPELDWS